MTNSIKITPDMTRDQWLTLRNSGIGGSDVATILGLNPYKTPLELYLSKVNNEHNDMPSESAYWGSTLENIVAQEFAKRTGFKVQHVNYILRRPEDPWMMANIDRAVVNPTIAKTVRLSPEKKYKSTGLLLSTDIGLECKTANQFMADQWGESQLEEIKKGEVTTPHKIPLYYETQVQWYMAVTGAKAFALAVLIGGNDFRAYWIARNDTVIEMIKQKCEAFMNNINTRTPPEPVNVDDIKRLYERDNGNYKPVTDDEYDVIQNLIEVKERIKALKEQEEELANQLIVSIGEYSGIEEDGRPLVTYKAQETSRFSTTEFRKANPELAEKYTKTSTIRVLRLK